MYDFRNTASDTILWRANDVIYAFVHARRETADLGLRLLGSS